VSTIESAPIQTEPETEDDEPKVAHIVMKDDQMRDKASE